MTRNDSARTESPLASEDMIWVAVAIILVGLGMVSISLALTWRAARGEGSAKSPEEESGATFIDEPLTVDLSAALAKRGREQRAASEQAAGPPATGADVGPGDAGDRAASSPQDADTGLLPLPEEVGEAASDPEDDTFEGPLSTWGLHAADQAAGQRTRVRATPPRRKTKPSDRNTKDPQRRRGLFPGRRSGRG